MLTQKRLKEVLFYSPLTGKFTWRISLSNVKPANTNAGHKHNVSGYIKIKIDTKLYSAHRLAFLYMTGSMPNQVDHTDHNTANNVWTNLVASSQNENAKNQKLHSTNSSGHVGVYWIKRNNKWGVRIHVKGVSKFLGSFTDKVDAIAARKAANIKYQYHVNHGK